MLIQLEMHDCVSPLREEIPQLAICVHICENEISCVRVRFCVCLTVWLGLSIDSMCVVWVCSHGSSDPLGSPCYDWVRRHPRVSDVKLWQSWTISFRCLSCFHFRHHFSLFWSFMMWVNNNSQRFAVCSVVIICVFIDKLDPISVNCLCLKNNMHFRTGYRLLVATSQYDTYTLS